MSNQEDRLDRLTEITPLVLPALIIGTLGVFGWLFYLSYKQTGDVLATLNDIGPVGGALGTLTLAIVTWATVREAKRSRQQQIDPHLTFEFTGEVYRGNIGVPAITNIGNGPAIDAEISIQFGEDGPSYLTKQHLRAGASIPITQPEFEELVRTDSDLYEEYDSLHLISTFKDVTGQSHRVEREINLEEVKATAAYSGMTPIDFG